MAGIFFNKQGELEKDIDLMKEKIEIVVKSKDPSSMAGVLSQIHASLSDLKNHIVGLKAAIKKIEKEL